MRRTTRARQSHAAWPPAGPIPLPCTSRCSRAAEGPALASAPNNAAAPSSPISLCFRTSLESDAEVTRPDEGAFDPAVLTDLGLLEEGN